MRTGLLAAIFIASGCASLLDEDDALAVIPYRVSTPGHVTVEVLINDQGPFDFALDTGASISVVFDKAREEVGLEHVAGERVAIQGTVGSGGFPVSKIDRLRVGGEVWKDARVALLPGDTEACAGLDGILGVDFLGRYAFGFSARDGVVRLYAPELVAERSYRGWASIPLQQLQIGEGDAAAFAVDLNFGSTTIPALVDLGAGTNMMNWRAARSIGIRPVKPRKDSEVSGAVDSAPVTAEVLVEALKISELLWRNETFIVADFQVFEVLDLEHRPVAIVGTGFFRHRDFVLDFVRKRLLIKVSAEKVAEREGFEPSKGY